MKLLVITFALLGGLAANAACVPDDGRHWNDLTRSQDHLRNVCKSRHHDNWRSSYDRNHDYDSRYDSRDEGHWNDFDRSQDHFRD